MKFGHVASFKQGMAFCGSGDAATMGFVFSFRGLNDDVKTRNALQNTGIRCAVVDQPLARAQIASIPLPQGNVRTVGSRVYRCGGRSDGCCIEAFDDDPVKVIPREKKKDVFRGRCLNIFSHGRELIHSERALQSTYLLGFGHGHIERVDGDLDIKRFDSCFASHIHVDIFEICGHVPTDVIVRDVDGNTLAGFSPEKSVTLVEHVAQTMEETVAISFYVVKTDEIGIPILRIRRHIMIVRWLLMFLVVLFARFAIEGRSTGGWNYMGFFVACGSGRSSWRPWRGTSSMALSRSTWLYLGWFFFAG